MEEKTAKELLKQLVRIADALEKKNSIEESKDKRRLKLERLEEKSLKNSLKSNSTTRSDSE